MPDIDEELIRDLLHRYTEDVRPRASVAREVAARQRRRHRHRQAVSVAATGAALGTAVGVLATVPGHGHTSPGGRSARSSEIRLTADQRVLYHLSSVAAGQPQGRGRYAVMTTEGSHLKDTSVINSRTGDMWGYQDGRDGNPSGKSFTAHYSPTGAQFAALPTSIAALRAALIAQWDKQVKPARNPLRTRGPHVRAIPLHVSDSDKIFQQASEMLWNPLVGPALRSALFRLLAAVPGVTVSPSAKDSIGRPAVEISRVDDSGLPGGKSDGIGYATYESAATGAVLESTVTYPPGSDVVTPQDPTGSSTVVDMTVYLGIRWARDVPADPYGSGSHGG